MHINKSSSLVEFYVFGSELAIEHPPVKEKQQFTHCDWLAEVRVVHLGHETDYLAGLIHQTLPTFLLSLTSLHLSIIISQPANEVHHHHTDQFVVVS